MRIAALAFGVVAGLIASLILALGGLDVAATAAAPDRQIQITRFALFILANIGVFGAGLVVASPLGGAILFVVGAVSWVIAALLLHHGVDLVLVVPPLLLVIATGFSGAAFFSRTQGFSLPPLNLGRRQTAPGPEEFDDLPPIPVGAGFYGNGGPAEPSRHDDEPSIDGLDGRDPPPVDWKPGKRRSPPPRQKPMFRPPDDDEYEESRFSRTARGISSVLSFGLYAAVGGALLLVFWNARTAEKAHPAAAKLEPAAVAEASTSAPSPASMLASAASTIQMAAASEAAAAPAAVAPDETAASEQAPPADSTPSISPQLMAGVVVADDPNNPVSFEAPRDILGTALAPQTQTQPSDATATTLDSSTASSASADQATDTSVVMPFPMPLSIAASRSGPSSRPAGRPAAAPAAPHGDVGL